MTSERPLCFSPTIVYATFALALVSQSALVALIVWAKMGLRRRHRYPPSEIGSVSSRSTSSTRSFFGSHSTSTSVALAKAFLVIAVVGSVVALAVADDQNVTDTTTSSTTSSSSTAAASSTNTTTIATTIDDATVAQYVDRRKLESEYS